MSDADEMTHDEWIHDKMIHDYAAMKMVAAADSDRYDGDGEMTTICSDGDVAAVLFDSSNSI